MKAHRSLRNVVVFPFLALVALSVVALGSPGHGIGSHIQRAAHQAAAKSVYVGPWMYGKTIDHGPWMYGKTIDHGPWMYGQTISHGPWMYAVVNGRPGRAHALQVTSHDLPSA
jgi:hypothetical protein